MEPLWDAEQVCEYLKIPKSTLVYWRQIEEGPPWIKVGRLVRYRPEEVKAWLDKQTNP